MADSPCCPIHGSKFFKDDDEWGPGCNKKVGKESPYANQNGWCAWTPKRQAAKPDLWRANGESKPAAASSSAAPQPAKAWGGKTPEERRSIEAQCSMKCAVELYAQFLEGNDIHTRATLISEMIATAYKINDGIRWMAGAKREEIRDAVQGPPPREPGEDDSEYEYTDEEAARLATRYGQR